MIAADLLDIKFVRLQPVLLIEQLKILLRSWLWSARKTGAVTAVSSVMSHIRRVSSVSVASEVRLTLQAGMTHMSNML